MSLVNMSRNVLELKSIYVCPDKIRTLKDASQVSELNGFDLKECFFETVDSPKNRVKDYAFFVRGDYYEAGVSVDKIKGTTHESYYGKNWLRMMMSLKRHTNDHDVERVFHAINDTDDRDRIRLSKYGEAYFIDGGGNHRVCQAKLLGLDTVPCIVTEFVFDERAYRKAQRLWAIKEINPPFVYQSYYDDGTLISLYCSGLYVNLHFCDREICALEDVLQRAKMASENPFKRMLSKACSQYFDKVFILSREENLEPLCDALTALVGTKEKTPKDLFGVS